MSCHRILQLLFYVVFISGARADVETENILKTPSIGVAVLVRNKYHTLPYFLSCLYNLNYPKDRMYLWIHSDFNYDRSDDILEKWVQQHAIEYNGVRLTTNKTSGPLHVDEKIATQWSPMHFDHVIQLRESALEYARQLWADYLLMIDADVFLTNKDTLKILVEKNLPVVAPMLISDGLYSNFWCGMTKNFYYERTEDYKPIQSRERQGCFQVPMVHSAVLMALRPVASDQLSYRPSPRYRGPKDDIIVFAVTATENNIPLYICNEEQYGFVPVPLEDSMDPHTDHEQLLNVKMEAISRHTPLPLNKNLAHFVEYPEPWKFGCDEMFMINLPRRPERRELMLLSFQELGMDVTIFEAVDGRELNMDDLSKHGVTLMPKYEDPYHKRSMKAGEVGCFLSHYYIWKEIVEKDYAVTLILEDDIHFVPFFRHRLINLLDEIESFDWDLVYLGRKILQDRQEQLVTAHTVRPLYSYWTLGYLLSLTGARKLLAADPLSKVLPVDEMLPIMFNQHPNDTWKSYFPNRNLNALSATPLLVHPTHYTGQPGYVSDTEDSQLVSPPPELRYKIEL